VIKVLEHGDPEEAHDKELARRIGDALCRIYPDHPWMVSFQGEGLIIRHLAIANAMAIELGREGFCSLLPRDKLGTYGQMMLEVMRFGGELLEAFGLPRGKWDGRAPIVPDHWKFKQDRTFH
jgi:hypothetical protein